MAATATNPTDFLTPKPTSTGIIGAAQASAAPPVDYSKQINDIYQSKFGRKADDEGMAFWTNAAKQNPTGDLASMITSGAQTQDRAAMADIGAGGVDTSQTWSDPSLNPNDVAAQKDVWDAASNKWVASKPAVAPSLTASSYTPSLLKDPAKWDVTKDQTVAGQMEKYADPNNPYAQMWGAQGAMGAAARGFTGNSTIRDTGILNSVMANAAPIASADASTQAKAAGYNTDESNQFSVANQNATNTAGAFNAAQANQLATSKYTADTSAATQLGVTDKNNATALAQSNLSANTQKYVADTSASTQLAVTKMNAASQAEISRAHDANSALIQGNTQAQQAYNSYVAAVAQIDQNAALDYNAKAAAINTQTQIFNSAIAGLKTANPGMGDVSSPLNLSAVSNAADAVGGVDVSQFLNFDA